MLLLAILYLKMPGLVVAFKINYLLKPLTFLSKNENEYNNYNQQEDEIDDNMYTEWLRLEFYATFNVVPSSAIKHNYVNLLNQFKG